MDSSFLLVCINLNYIGNNYILHLILEAAKWGKYLFTLRMTYRC